MKLIFAMIVAGMAAAANPACAEIEKTASLECQGICLYVWPKITIPQGWERDIEFSHTHNVNFIYPVADPNNVGIYAGAVSFEGQANSVDGFIADDRLYFIKHHPELSVEDGPRFLTADGEVLKSLSFTPMTSGNYDITAYGSEVDSDGNGYYITFSLSAPTKAQRDAYLPLFFAVVGAYHK